jgi:hypothetical protein
MRFLMMCRRRRRISFQRGCDTEPDARMKVLAGIVLRGVPRGADTCPPKSSKTRSGTGSASGEISLGVPHPVPWPGHLHWQWVARDRENGFRILSVRAHSSGSAGDPRTSHGAVVALRDSASLAASDPVQGLHSSKCPRPAVHAAVRRVRRLAGAHDGHAAVRVPIRSPS